MEKAFVEAWELSTNFIAYVLGLALPYLLILFAGSVIVGIVWVATEAVREYHATKNKKL